MTINGYILTSKDVAHLLYISPDEVAELALRKELKAEKVGRLWRYKFEDVMAYKRKRERTDIPQRLPVFPSAVVRHGPSLG